MPGARPVAVRPPKPAKLDPRELQDAIDSIHETLRGVLAHDPVQGRRIAAVDVTTSPTRIAHGLQRRPVGWFVCDLAADARVWRASWDERFLTLQASTAVTIDLMVF